MTKMILIESCNTCPSKDHKGAFGRVQYVPVCRRTNKELGYTVHADMRGNVGASYNGIIPSFCPLMEYKK